MGKNSSTSTIECCMQSMLLQASCQLRQPASIAQLDVNHFNRAQEWGRIPICYDQVILSTCQVVSSELRQRPACSVSTYLLTTFSFSIPLTHLAIILHNLSAIQAQISSTKTPDWKQ